MYEERIRIGESERAREHTRAQHNTIIIIIYTKSLSNETKKECKMLFLKAKTIKLNIVAATNEIW